MNDKTRAAMQQALEALEMIATYSEEDKQCDNGYGAAWVANTALTAMQEALAEPKKPDGCANGCPPLQVCDYCQRVEQAEQEPVAYTNKEQLGYLKDPRYQEAPMAMWSKSFDKRINVSLYAAPVRTKDLTDKQIEKVWNKNGGYMGMPIDFARAVIAADREKNKC